MTAEQKIKYLPAGGIAGFVMSDEQVEHLEAEELQEQYGTTGIAQFSTIGKNMANFGRHGDDTVAHVETGELIVPRALIENNPKLKESIFNHLRELGVEDPERYVVGESKNSLNPTTGLPEFFFKKLFRSVSKVAKGVGKALKKAAPILLPIVLAMTPLGPIYGAALGSGIGTLVQGGSTEDALKSALIAGASGAAYAGMTGGTAGISKALANPMGRIGQTATGFGNTFSGEGFTGQTATGESTLFSEYRPEGQLTDKQLIEMQPKTSNFSKNIKDGNQTDTFYDKTKDFMFGKDATQKELYAEAGQLQREALAENYNLSSREAMKQAKINLNPDYIRSMGPSLALATAAGAAGGMFDTPKDEPMEETRSGQDVYSENPDIYNVASMTPQYIVGDPNVASKYPYYIPQAAAQGGQIFPRRVGGIMPDEGIPDKDSVRAMLMPGEFVMTTDAVKGLGGGDMNKGINNMYGVMRNLEQRGRQA